MEGILINKMSDWLLFNAKMSIFQQYHMENKLHIDEMMSSKLDFL